MDKAKRTRLAELIGDFQCDGCGEMSTADLEEARELIAEYSTELEKTRDKSVLGKVGNLATIGREIETVLSDRNAEFEAEVARAKGIASEPTADATDDDEDFEPVTPADNRANTARAFTVIATDKKGRPLGGDPVVNVIDVSKVIAAGTERYSNSEGRVPLVSGAFNFDNIVTIGAGDDDYMTTMKLMEAVQRFEAYQGEHLAADGSFCAPVTPDLSFCDQTPTTITSFSASLPKAGTIRGRVQYMDTPTNDDFYDLWGGVETDTFPGVGTRFDEDDSQAVDPDNQATWKQCVEIDCPDQQPPAELVAHYSCINFAHFTWKAYPEYINLYIQKALQAHELKKSLTLLAEVRGVAQTVDPLEPIPGSVTGFFSALDTQLSAYRDAFWLDRNHVLDIVQPHWVLKVLRAALARRADFNELEALRVPDSAIQALYASIGARVNYVTGYARLAHSAANPVVPDAGVGLWPNSIPTLMWVPGAVVELVQPDWNIGIERLRDTTTQRQNKYSVFVEDFNGLAYPCPYPVQEFDIEFCPTGASTSPITVACADVTGEESPSA